MTVTAPPERQVTGTPGSAPGGRLRTALLVVIGVGLLLLGGGAAVALGIGRATPPASDSVDAGFARDMSAHHLQAVEMANLVPDRSADDAVRGLAFDIAETQQNQAGRMQGWLSLWGLPLTGGERMTWTGSGHAGHSMAEGAQMPGMATEDELAGLRALSGEEFDVRFLQLMTRHHQGGFEMAEYAAGAADEPTVQSLARAIVGAQSAETDLMVGMLTERGGEPLPAP